MRLVKADITCSRCGITQEYDDEGTFDCMPDGVCVGGDPDDWVCSECMVDDDGNTLPEFN